MKSEDEHGKDNSCWTAENFMLERVKPKGNVIYDSHMEAIFTMPSCLRTKLCDALSNMFCTDHVAKKSFVEDLLLEGYIIDKCKPKVWDTSKKL